MAKDDVGKETWLPGAATVLAIVSCYGTAAAVTLLSLLGISIAIDERAWAGAIMVFAALASAAIVASCRRHRQAGPAMLAGLSLALIASAMYGAYGRVIELAGFALLAGAAAWDWKARTSRKDAGAGTSWIAAETLAARLHGPQSARLVDHVAVPLRVDVVNVAEDALIHHALHGLIKVAVAPLEAGLQDLLGTLLGERTQRVHLLRLEHQAFFAENMLARR